MRASRLIAIASTAFFVNATWNGARYNSTQVDDRAILNAVESIQGKPLAEAYQPKNAATKNKRTIKKQATPSVLLERGSKLSNSIAVSVAEEVGPLWGNFVFVGEKCGNSDLSNKGYSMSGLYRKESFPSHGKYGAQLTLNPHSHVAACMKKCELVGTAEEELPCTGIQISENGECNLHFMEIVSKDAVNDANVPYGCYRRVQIPEKDLAPGFSHIGAGACVSTYHARYSAQHIKFNPPWSVSTLVDYCRKICVRHEGCAAFTAAEACFIYMESVASEVDPSEKAYLQKPLGCYVKNEKPNKTNKELGSVEGANDETKLQQGGIKPTPTEEVITSGAEQNEQQKEGGSDVAATVAQAVENGVQSPMGTIRPN